MILQYNDIHDEMIKYYDTGGGKTFYVGFKCLSEFYNIKEGGVTDWTGYPQSGKTELLFEVLKNCSRFYGHKHLIYMPDAGTNEDILAKLIHKVTGKQVDEFFYNSKGDKVLIENRISKEDMIKELPWILEHFKIFNPKNNEGRPKSVTPVEFWDYACKNKDELQLFSAVIDSWNYMLHNTDGQMEHKWLEETLSYRNWLAETSKLHFHTIIHPSKPTKDNKGNVSMPDMYSLKGGSEWANNGKAIIVVHREFGSDVTDIKIAKAKPKIVGRQGITCLQYDTKKGAYYELVDGVDGGGKKKFAERLENKQQRITSNNEFNKAPF